MRLTTSAVGLLVGLLGALAACGSSGDSVFGDGLGGGDPSGDGAPAPGFAGSSGAPAPAAATSGCNTIRGKVYDPAGKNPLYGATVFEVLQTYTTTLPKNLWLAVNADGIHIMRRRSKEPLISYGYRNIVNYR